MGLSVCLFTGVAGLVMNDVKRYDTTVALLR